MSLIHIFSKVSVLKKIAEIFLVKRARDIESHLSKYLRKDKKLMDLGAGSCHITKFLQEDGFRVKSVDVQNISFCDNVRPSIYDGTNLPFSKNEFDVTLLISVLHHTLDPLKVLTEAVRVTAETIIIEEDVIISPLQKFYTFLLDNILNLEFFTNPHSNKTDKEWRQLFNKLNLTIKDVRYHKSHLFLRHATYVLSK